MDEAASTAWPEWVDPDTGARVKARRMESRFAVESDTLRQEGKPGDYLVKGGDGLRRVVKRRVFEKRYQPVEEPANG